MDGKVTANNTYGLEWMIEIIPNLVLHTNAITFHNRKRNLFNQPVNPVRWVYIFSHIIVICMHTVRENF